MGFKRFSVVVWNSDSNF